MLVELKNGETLNGLLLNCDTWMNLTLKEVVQTSPVRLPLPSGAKATWVSRHGKGLWLTLGSHDLGRRQVRTAARSIREGQQCTFAQSR